MLVLWCYRKPRFELEVIHLTIKAPAMAKLDHFRSEAIEAGVLKRSKDDYVPCQLAYKGDSLKGKIRLKGDWVDHLSDGKWSFRVKLKDGFVDSVETFSLQSPKSRDFLNGYVFHRLLRYHNILSPKMTFVELVVNGDSWGIYNFEEHLSDEMTIHQGRGEGVILNFQDDIFFEAVQNNDNLIGLIAKAKIKLKANKSILKNNQKQVEKATSIIKNYQSQTDSLYRDFNHDKMAKYYAICDLTRAYHAMGWINIRFFYDLKTELMEPIGYDGYPVMDWGMPYLGHQALHAKTTKHKLDQVKVVYSALYNDRLKAKYYDNLQLITNSAAINSFIKSIKADLTFYESEIQKEFRAYSYDWSFLPTNGTEIRKALNEDGF